VQPLEQWKSNKYYIFFGTQHAMLGTKEYVQLYNIFPQYLINSMIKKKVTENKMCVLIFSIILSETLAILGRNG